jgi:hypothetical protein
MKYDNEVIKRWPRLSSLITEPILDKVVDSLTNDGVSSLDDSERELQRRVELKQTLVLQNIKLKEEHKSILRLRAANGR